MDPLPTGYTVWRERVTPEMRAWAVEVERSTRSYANGGYGLIFLRDFGGVPVAARVEPHTWTTDAQGNRIPCNPVCHGVTLYHPPASAQPAQHQPAQPTSTPTTSNADKTALTISLIVLAAGLFGTALTAATTFFRAYQKRTGRA